MSEMVERVALAIFLSQYPEGSAPAPESREFWPDNLDQLVSGTPFTADGYREMARAAIEAVRLAFLNEAKECQFSSDREAMFMAVETIDEALQPAAG